jgi:hypothetical protein
MSAESTNGIGREEEPDDGSSADELSLQEILDRCWTAEDRKAAIRKLSETAADKGTLAIIKLLLEYTYGKPTDRYEPDIETGPSVPNDVYEAIKRIYGKHNIDTNDSNEVQE